MVRVVRREKDMRDIGPAMWSGLVGIRSRAFASWPLVPVHCPAFLLAPRRPSSQSTPLTIRTLAPP